MCYPHHPYFMDEKAKSDTLNENETPRPTTFKGLSWEADTLGASSMLATAPSLAWDGDEGGDLFANSSG